MVLTFSASAWAEMRSVRVKIANFREAPAESADVLFTADRYYPVKILERKRGWVRIRDFEGEIAWVAERLLGSEKAVVVVVKQTALRDRPASDGATVIVAAWSDSFVVKQVRAGWVLVASAAGKEGWVSSSAVWGLEP